MGLEGECPQTRRLQIYEVNRDLPQEIFEIIMKSVQGALSAFAVLVEDKSSPPSPGTPQSEVKDKLKKNFGGNRKGFKAEVLVSREKPFVIAYNYKRKQVTLVVGMSLGTVFTGSKSMKLPSLFSFTNYF